MVGQIHGPIEYARIKRITRYNGVCSSYHSAAATWFNTLDATVKSSLTAMHMTFVNCFKPVSHYATDPFYFTQVDTKSIEEFIQRVSLKPTDIKDDSPKMMGRIMSGFMPNIRADFISPNPTTMEHCWQNIEPGVRNNGRLNSEQCNHEQRRQFSGGTGAERMDKQHKHRKYS